MSFFKPANLSSSTEYRTPDGEDYLLLRDELAKTEVNNLYVDSPAGDDDRRGQISFIESLMELMIVGWSYRDENGNERPFDVVIYRQLNAQVTAWMEKTVNDHFRKATGADAENVEKKPTS